MYGKNAFFVEVTHGGGVNSKRTRQPAPKAQREVSVETLARCMAFIDRVANS
jgi:hypothetical protein